MPTPFYISRPENTKEELAKKESRQTGRGVLPLHILPTRLTKSFQQEVVADFIYEKNLEMCMFIYLDEFLNNHCNLFSSDATIFGKKDIKKLLEASYQAIREKIDAKGLLTEEAAGEYMLRKK